MNGIDATRRARGMWIVDFGTSLSEQEAALYTVPFDYVKKFVKPERDKNPEKSSRELWWRHQRPRPEMREATRNLKRFIVTPEVSKHRTFIWLDRSVLPDKKLIVVASESDAMLGLLSSRLHEIWTLATGGRHGVGNDPYYNPTQCFQTFPFPKPSTFVSKEIAAAAKRLNELRESWLNPPEWVDVVPEVVAGYPDRIIPKPEFAKAIKERTLTKLYNLRAKGEVQWLEDAHRALDAAVAKAYGWDDYSPEMPDEEILRRLLKLNLERAAKQ